MKTSAEKTNNVESYATKIPGGYQRSQSHNHYTTKRLYEKERVDPELEAEIALARENGVPYIPPPPPATAAVGGNSNGKPIYRRQVSEVLTKAAKVLERDAVVRDADYDDDSDDGSDGPGNWLIVHLIECGDVVNLLA